MREYSKDNIKISRILRKQMTTYERKLWYLFLKDYPIRFKRQTLIGEYVADFYCAKARLVIELDGKWHSSSKQYEKDCKRTDDLKKMGYTVFRVANSEVTKNFKKVCKDIDNIVKGTLPQSASLTATSAEGAEMEEKRQQKTAF